VRAGLRPKSPAAFDRINSMPIPLHSLHLRRSRERERVEEHPLAHARGHNPTRPKPASRYRSHRECVDPGPSPRPVGGNLSAVRAHPGNPWFPRFVVGAPLAGARIGMVAHQARPNVHPIRDHSRHSRLTALFCFRVFRVFRGKQSVVRLITHPQSLVSEHDFSSQRAQSSKEITETDAFLCDLDPSLCALCVSTPLLWLRLRRAK
jgi:hypothetical protein